jgi:manganese oxidase
MMAGDGPFGALEMGGMFSVVKVRDDVRPGDYRDPGWFKHPAGTVASEYTVEEGDAVPRAPRIKADDHTLDVRKPGPHEGH